MVNEAEGKVGGRGGGRGERTIPLSNSRVQREEDSRLLIGGENSFNLAFKVSSLSFSNFFLPLF